MMIEKTKKDGSSETLMTHAVLLGRQKRERREREILPYSIRIKTIYIDFIYLLYLPTARSFAAKVETKKAYLI